MNDSTTQTPRPDAPGGDPVVRTLCLTASEVITLRRALHRQRRESLKAQAYNDRRGWQPRPGERDANALFLRDIERLLPQLPHAEDRP